MNKNSTPHSLPLQHDARATRSESNNTRQLFYFSLAMNWRTALELGVLGAIWGASFLFMRIAATDFGAVSLVELRLALGAFILLPFLWHVRDAFTAVRWRILALIGLVNSAIPFMLFAWGAQRAPAGVGAIANAMTVLFTALIGFLFFGEKINSKRAIALFVGFAGVVVLASGKTAGASIGWAVAAGVTAAFFYGLESILCVSIWLDCHLRRSLPRHWARQPYCCCHLPW